MTTPKTLLIAHPMKLLAALALLAGLAFAARVPMARAAEEGGAKVSIANFAFTPEEITIAAGESVTWTNDDGAPHGLEYRDGAPGVNPLLPGAAFSRRFDKPGTYEYNCSVHPYMTGRVVVRGR
jgi:plastocyanin